jgi:transposase
VFILEEPRVGQCAEFYWGEVILFIGGIWSKFYFAVSVLLFSLYRFARLYPRSTRLEVIQIQAHTEFFHEIGAVSESIFYDRMSVVYDSKKQKMNDKFLEFSMLSGFCPCVFNPALPHEKGTDEESVGYIRRLTFDERHSFESFEAAIEWLSTFSSRLTPVPSTSSLSVPVQGLAQERDLMHPLPDARL